MMRSLHAADSFAPVTEAAEGCRDKKIDVISGLNSEQVVIREQTSI
jgi:hypothetical protein